MDADELQRFEALLRERRADLMAERERQAATMEGLRGARADANADDEHDPEGPTLSSEWSRIVGVSGDMDAQLREIDAALERTADGSYGTCARCGSAVGSGRLEARPAATLCIRCASERDGR